MRKRLRKKLTRQLFTKEEEKQLVQEMVDRAIAIVLEKWDDTARKLGLERLPPLGPNEFRCEQRPPGIRERMDRRGSEGRERWSRLRCLRLRGRLR